MIHSVLAHCARHGRLVLIIGLVAGIALPELARAMRPWIGHMVAVLLLLAALRVGPRQAVGALGDLRASFGLAVLLQLGFPLAALVLFQLLGLSGTTLATFFILTLAAPPVTGSANFTIMTGNDGAPALRVLVVGIALVPLTVVPVFWLTPALGEPAAVLGAAGGLMGLIVVSVGLAFLLRATVLRQPSRRALDTVDGLSAIAMAIVVIGLMSAVGPALRETPLRFTAILLLVCAVNFGVQIATATLVRFAGHRAQAAALGIVSVNRNVALFLTVLPAETIDPILLYIGCFQIPMYLTPAVLSRFYRLDRAASA